MSKFTITLEEYIRNYSQTNNIDELVATMKERVFNMTFPWYDGSSYNPASGEIPESLNEFLKLFLEEYLQEEIAYETIGVFKMKLDKLLREKMPYYHNIWRLKISEVNPLINVDLSHKTDNTHSDNTTTSSSENGSGDKTNSSTTGSTESSTNTVGTTESGTTKNTNTGTSTTSGSENTTTNLQGFSSDNPQVNFAGQDYANAMQRSETVTGVTSSGSVSVSSTDDCTTSLKRDENGSSSGKRDETATGSEEWKDEKTTSGTNDTSGQFNETRTELGFTGNKAIAIKDYLEIYYNLNALLLKDCDILFLSYYGSGYQGGQNCFDGRMIYDNLHW